MTDIDENETVKAKMLWEKKPAGYANRSLTQPKDHTKTTSNLDKNYEELTQKRGATEGALSSKVRKWEDWTQPNFQKKETEDSDQQDLSTETKQNHISTETDKKDEIEEDQKKKNQSGYCCQAPRGFGTENFSKTDQYFLHY